LRDPIQASSAQERRNVNSRRRDLQAALFLVRWFYTHLLPPIRYITRLFTSSKALFNTGFQSHDRSVRSLCQLLSGRKQTVANVVRLHWSMFTRRELLAISPALLLSACSSAPPTRKVAEKAPEPITGLHALYQMYTAARAWAQDLQILHYSSINITEVPRQPGKAPAWQVVFVSPALRMSRTYSFSVYEASATLHQGLFPDAAEPWSGGGKTFLIETAKVDTDTVWETALKHGGEYNSKNPNLPISYTLGMDRGSDPMWRVIWGQTAGESSFSVLVDASTGEFVQILH
jgi:hypothetical protein